MKTYWIYEGRWKRVTLEKYLAYYGMKEVRDEDFKSTETSRLTS